MRYLPVLTPVYIDSGAVTTVAAAVDHYYVIDTATAAVTITLPIGVDIGHWIMIQNAPANGPQMGGGTTGHNVTIAAGWGETLESASTVTLGPPTSTVTAKGQMYHPVGPGLAAGFGAGWVRI